MTTEHTPFYKLPLMSLDTETTGVDSFNDRIVTCNITYDFLDRDPYICDWLINPGVPIPEGASAVHGITDDVAIANGSDPRAALVSIAEHLNAWEDKQLPIVVYNAPFDITLLIAEFKRYNVECRARFRSVIDPLVLDKGLDPWRKGSRKLTDTAAHYGIVLDNAHSADADSLASVKIARAIGEKFEIDSPMWDVHETQRDWKFKQSQSFQKYLREKKGEVNAYIDPSWPFRVPAEEVF